MSTAMQDLITYSVTNAALAEMRTQYGGLRVLGVDDAEGYAVCKEARKVVRAKRLEVENRRKELKAESLAFGRAVDNEAARITEAIAEIEGHLVGQLAIVDDEKKRREEEAKKAAIARIEGMQLKLQSVGCMISFSDATGLTDEAFATKYEQAKAQHEEAERLRKEEQARLAELEAQRIAADEQARKDRERIAQLEADKRRMEEEAAAKQRDQERLELAKAEEARKAAEIEKQAAEAALCREREQREREAEEERLKKAAEEQAAQERIADKKLFDEIKSTFPTLELAWVEIARLRKAKRVKE